MKRTARLVRCFGAFKGIFRFLQPSQATFNAVFYGEARLELETLKHPFSHFENFNIS